MGKPKKGRRTDRQRFSRRDGQYDLENDEDIALLSKPFEASIKGVIDLMKAFENGTREVQYLLQYECGLLFECRVCRSIFRSIVNFITHKRVYCRGKGPSDSSQTGQSFDEFMKDMQSLVILQEPEVCEQSTSPTTVNTNNNTISETTSGEKPSPPRLSKRKAFPRKNLIEVLDRLCQKESLEKERPVVIASKDHACVSSVGESKQTMPILRLDKIDQTAVAMRQTVTLGPDGKILNDKHHTKGDSIIEDVSLDEECGSSQSEIKSIERLCKPCNIKFSTRKTFRQHLKSKHNSNPSWYLCPDCNSIFSQIYSVHRHLRRFHRKSESQMQKLHGKIKHLPENQLPASYKVSVTNKKPVSKITLRENKKAVVNPKDAVLENELVELCLTEKNTCSGCTRKFERVAAFNTHMQTCPRRPVLNSTKSQSDTTSLMFRHLIRHSSDGFLTRANVAETLDTKTLTNVANPHHFTSHPEITDDNAEFISNSSDFQSQSVLMNHRTRHESEMRFVPPVKRIEIQLRMDYNKVNIGQSQSLISSSGSDLLETHNAANTRRSPDTVVIDEKIKPEENKSASTNRTQVVLLSVTEEDTTARNVKRGTSNVQNNQLPTKPVMEEGVQGTAISSTENQSTSVNNSITDNMFIEKHDTPSTEENIKVETNSNKDDMPQCDQKAAGNDVLDESAQQSSSSGNCSKNTIVDTCLEDGEVRKLFDVLENLEVDNSPKIAAVTRPELIVNTSGWQKFSSLRGGQNHVEKCHTTDKVCPNSGQSGVVANSWTCISNNSKGSTSLDTSQLESKANGDLGQIDPPTSDPQDSGTNQLLSLADTLEIEGSTSLEEPNHSKKCSSIVRSASSKLAGMSTTKQIPKITTPSFQKKRKVLVADKNELLNINEYSSSIIGLRPKRHRMNSRVNATAINVDKLVKLSNTLDDQRPIKVKTARKTQKATKLWADKEKTDLHSDSKRAKVEFLLAQPVVDVSSENVPDLKPYMKETRVTTSTGTSSEEIDPRTTVVEETTSVPEPIKAQVQDNTNIYKNVSKSVIEVIFGSELSNSMFSTDNFATEEEVTIIEDQISGTFSLDISSTPEKSKENLNAIPCSSSTRRRISFSLDSEQISSPDSGQGSSDMVLEASHSAEDLLNSAISVNASSTVINENLLSDPTALENFRAQTSCPIVFLDNKLTVNNEMLVETDETCNTSAKESSVSLVKTIPAAEEAKMYANKISLPGYNISTRKSMRVFDTKPLRRTPSVDADVHCKR